MLVRDVKAKKLDPVWQTDTETNNSRKPYMLVPQEDGRLFLGADRDPVVWATKVNVCNITPCHRTQHKSTDDMAY